MCRYDVYLFFLRSRTYIGPRLPGSIVSWYNINITSIGTAAQD